MANIQRNPKTVFPPYRNFAHAVDVPAGARTLYISGLNGYEIDGVTMPPDFSGQARLVWRHLNAILTDAGMEYSDLVSLRFFLASSSDDAENVMILTEHLGEHLAARTVVVQQLLDPHWLVEVEAIAARVD